DHRPDHRRVQPADGPDPGLPPRPLQQHQDQGAAADALRLRLEQAVFPAEAGRLRHHVGGLQRPGRRHRPRLQLVDDGRLVMAVFVIGGEAIEVSLPNWKAQKRGVPQIEAATQNPGLIAATDAVLNLVSVGGAPQYSVEELEEKLTPAEALKLPSSINALLVEMGLAKAKDSASGEVKPAEEGASPSTATLTASSPESSSD